MFISIHEWKNYIKLIESGRSVLDLNILSPQSRILHSIGLSVDLKKIGTGSEGNVYAIDSEKVIKIGLKEFAGRWYTVDEYLIENPNDMFTNVYSVGIKTDTKTGDIYCYSIKERVELITKSTWDSVRKLFTDNGADVGNFDVAHVLASNGRHDDLWSPFTDEFFNVVDEASRINYLLFNERSVDVAEGNFGTDKSGKLKIFDS